MVRTYGAHADTSHIAHSCTHRPRRRQSIQLQHEHVHARIQARRIATVGCSTCACSLSLSRWPGGVTPNCGPLDDRFALPLTNASAPLSSPCRRRRRSHLCCRAARLMDATANKEPVRGERETPMAAPPRSRRRPQGGRRPRACDGEARTAGCRRAEGSADGSGSSRGSRDGSSGGSQGHNGS